MKWGGGGVERIKWSEMEGKKWKRNETDLNGNAFQLHLI